ncbi:MAG: response regulator [Bacteroidota bacterium]
MQKKYHFYFVNDSEYDQFLITNIIELDQLPIRAQFESNPEIALQQLCKMAGTDFPDVIIADVRLPLFDGFEFAERYREAFYYSFPNTLLFLSSSSLSVGDRQRLRCNALIADVLLKPFSLQIFKTHIMRHLEIISVG